MQTFQKLSSKKLDLREKLNIHLIRLRHFFLFFIMTLARSVRFLVALWYFSRWCIIVLFVLCSGNDRYGSPFIVWLDLLNMQWWQRQSHFLKWSLNVFLWTELSLHFWVPIKEFGELIFFVASQFPASGKVQN